MIKVISVEEFYKSDFNLTFLSAVFQTQGLEQKLTYYTDTPRPNSGFLLLLADITMTYVGAGFEIVLKKGDIIYLPQGVKYTVILSKPPIPARIRSCLVNFMFEDGAGDCPVFSDRPVLFSAENSKDVSYILDIAHELSRPEKSPYCVKARFYSLIDSIIRAMLNTRVYYYSIRKGVKYLEENWNQDVKIGELAELCGVSENYFRILFAKWSGMNPAEYRNSLRVANAKALLSQNSVSIADVAYAVGFDDQFYFSRVFKKFTGVSPREYRDTLRSPGDEVNSLY